MPLANDCDSTSIVSEKPAKIAALILAAGSSRRLGQPKQLLEYQGISLVRRAASTAILSGLEPTTLVLGAAAKEVANELAGLPVEMVTNEGWSWGIGSSIRAGVASLNRPDVEAVVLMLVDQPFLTPVILGQFVSAYRDTKSSIIASRYAETLGVPTLFAKEHFQRLLQLPDNVGAKALIAQAGPTVHVVEFPDGAVDIDTIRDLESLRQCGG